MNPHLVNFYKTWLHWATHENAQNPARFQKEQGLCSGLWRYGHWLGLDQMVRNELIEEMCDQFNEHGLSSVIPFNMEGIEYPYELDKRKNPLRIQWCIDRIAEAEAYD